jgi:hypothetical protein
MLWAPKKMISENNDTEFESEGRNALKRLFGAIERNKNKIYLINGVSYDKEEIPSKRSNFVDWVRSRICYGGINNYGETYCPGPRYNWKFIDRGASVIDWEYEYLPTHHAKFVLLSKTYIKGKKREWVSCVTSTNFNFKELTNKLQDMVCTFDDYRIYNDIRNKFWEKSSNNWIVIGDFVTRPIRMFTGTGASLSELNESLNPDNTRDDNYSSVFWPRYGQGIIDKIIVISFGERFEDFTSYESEKYTDFLYEKVLNRQRSDYEEELYIIQAESHKSFSMDLYRLANLPGNTGSPIITQAYYVKHGEGFSTTAFFNQWESFWASFSDYPVPLHRIITFHIKIAWHDGKPGNERSFVLMGSRNAKNYSVTDIDYFIKSNNGSEKDIFDDYSEFIDYVKDIEI